MPGIFQTTIERAGVEAATIPQHRRALKSSYEFIAKRHHRLYKMLKFHKRAVRRYGLKPRRGNPGSGRKFAGSYAQAKVEKRRLFFFSNEPLPIGENKPFVWSGRTRQLAAGSRAVRSKATNAGKGFGEAIIRTPQLNRAGRQKRIDLIEEFQRVTPGEVKEQERAGARHYEKSLRRMRARKVTKH